MRQRTCAAADVLAGDSVQGIGLVHHRLFPEREKRKRVVNVVNDVIVFHGLTRANLQAIIDLELAKVRERLAERGITLELTDDAREYIIEKGYNPDFGARPLRRAIENMIEEPLSEELLRGTFKENVTIKVSLEPIEGSDAKKLNFHAEETVKPAGEPVAAGSQG